MMSMGGIYRRRSLDLDLGVLHCTVLYVHRGYEWSRGSSRAGEVERDGRGTACLSGLCKLYLKG
jgi:hypothetical protein